MHGTSVQTEKGVNDKYEKNSLHDKTMERVASSSTSVKGQEHNNWGGGITLFHWSGVNTLGGNKHTIGFDTVCGEQMVCTRHKLLHLLHLIGAK